MGFFGRLIFALIALVGYGLTAICAISAQYRHYGPASDARDAQIIWGIGIATTGLLLAWRWVCGGARRQ